MPKEVNRNRFVLVLLNEEQYISHLHKIVQSVEKRKNKICYVCLSRPYKDILSDLKKNNIDINLFFFVDTLSSYYERPKITTNCIFLESPANLGSIKKAVEKAIEKEKCNILLIDTISALLVYEGNFSILKFTNSLATEEKEKKVEKFFIALKKNNIPEKENKELLKDLKMFADKTVELSD